MKAFKKMFLFVFSALLFLIATPSQSAYTFWSAGELTNPATNAILADTGLMTGPVVGINMKVMISCTVACNVHWETVDAAGTTLHSFIIPIPAGQSFREEIPISWDQSQLRVRLRLRTGITGFAQGLLYQP